MFLNLDMRFFSYQYYFLLLFSQTIQHEEIFDIISEIDAENIEKDIITLNFGQDIHLVIHCQIQEESGLQEDG